MSPKDFLLAMWWEPALRLAAEGSPVVPHARQAIGTSSLASALRSRLGSNSICKVSGRANVLNPVDRARLRKS